ncbi:MAG TPA: hypothetical protein VHJ34_01400 [Actinomycetota bacterium]|nr:hypothetical protein [Actinomycetota bacterium]
MSCHEIRAQLPAYATRGDAPLSVRRHVARCAACAAELARYEELRDALGGLTTHVVEPPPGLARALADIPARDRRIDHVRTHVVRNRKAYAGGVVIALAGAGATALWRARVRRPAAA